MGHRRQGVDELSRLGIMDGGCVRAGGQRQRGTRMRRFTAGTRSCQFLERPFVAALGSTLLRRSITVHSPVYFLHCSRSAAAIHVVVVVCWSSVENGTRRNSSREFIGPYPVSVETERVYAMQFTLPSQQPHLVVIVFG